MRLVAATVVLAVGCASAPPPSTPQPTRGPSAQAAPSPTPTPVPMPKAVPTVPPPAAMPGDDLDPPRVRVLLRRSSSPVELPQPGRTYRVTVDGTPSWLWGPLRLQVTASGSRWWQVGAYSDPSSTAAAMTRLQQTFGSAVQVGQVPTDGGLTRVRIRWPSGEPADPPGELAAAGFPGGFAKPAPGVLRIDGAQNQSVSSMDEMLIEPAGEWPVAVESRRYRGRLRARAVGDEVLVINELNLESYLKGVVPAEMGPSQFPELDALKAQTVAARTYTVAHLGDHDDEGWDLCDTPVCQVYHGVGVEHRLSNRAVSETAGLIAVFNDEPINAMYTSTCGGHTEDSSLLFTGRAQPYLVGVPCAWERMLPLAGTGQDGPWVLSTGFSAGLRPIDSRLRALGCARRNSPARPGRHWKLGGPAHTGGCGDIFPRSAPGRRGRAPCRDRTPEFFARPAPLSDGPLQDCPGSAHERAVWGVAGGRGRGRSRASRRPHEGQW